MSSENTVHYGHIAVITQNPVKWKQVNEICLGMFLVNVASSWWINTHLRLLLQNRCYSQKDKILTGWFTWCVLSLPSSMQRSSCCQLVLVIFKIKALVQSVGAWHKHTEHYILINHDMAILMMTRYFMNMFW